jgi:thioredoxin reductase (NADPH)
MGHEKVVIVGSGPAALTAAIYTSRAMLAPLVIEGTQPGGQLMIATDVENFPGFAEGIPGPELMSNMRRQAERFGTRFRMEVVTSVKFRKPPLTVFLGDETITSDTVIIATGAAAKYLGLESEKKWHGRGVSACATCDGFFFKDRTVVVVGGGDTAAEEALYLTRFADKVHVIHRRDELRASKFMQKRLLHEPKIEIIWDSIVTEVLGEEPKGVTGVLLRNVKTGEEHLFPCDGMFLGIGHTPSTSFLGDQLVLDENGYIVTEGGSVTTAIPGVFAAGDCKDPVYRQAVTAVGSGCMAAIEAERYLHETQNQ